MPLPLDNSQWMPKEWERMYYKYAEWAAWYGSNTEDLINLYTDHLNEEYVPGNKFRLNKLRKEIETYLHVPIAADIASTSSNLLFGEQPIIRIPDAHIENASASAKATQTRLDYILRKGEFFTKLLEAGESASALGGIFIKPNWDIDFLNFPIIDIVQADSALPTFKWGFLEEVIFHKCIYEDNSNYYRLLEYHTKGHIENALYKGKSNNLGIRIPLNYLPQTADMQDDIDTGINDLMVRYIANIRPNRICRGSGLGNSDYQGNEGLFDSINQAYTSWIKEIKLGQARIIVPEQWLERKNGEFGFPADREVFTALDIDPLAAKGMGINQVQFHLRVTEHKDTVTQFILQAISDSGYSPQSFGMDINGNAQSGTALNIRERKSIITTGKKQIFYQSALQDLLEMLIQIDKVVFKTSNLEILPITLEFQDSLSFDLGQTATTIDTLNRAQAISTAVKVQMAHPTWTNEQIDSEVKDILNETGQATVNIDNMPT